MGTGQAGLMTDTEKSVLCSDTGATALVAGRFFFFLSRFTSICNPEGNDRL